MNKRSAVLLVAVVLVLALSAAGAAAEITLMTWGGDFIPREIIQEFERETGIRVNYKEVTSNEDMQSLLEANPDQYDLLVTTDYMVDILRQNGMLERLNKSKLPNYANINPVYLGKYYDPDSEYAIP
ncbi:MAG TPA: extracellular solute-binding protein, partial [Limnochordia bacterium]|nr:extracellular solute-binding protein [Limnochordia bacterium]